MSQILVYNEQLVGTVDGTNKTFTSVHPVSYVESLRLGGAEYTDFTVVGNVFTLTDAPTVATGSPYSDYFWDDGAIPVGDSAKTFIDAIDDVYLKLGQNSTSRQFPLSLTKAYVKEGIKVMNNERANPRKKVGEYSFNKAVDVTVTSYSATEIPV